VGQLSDALDLMSPASGPMRPALSILEPRITYHRTCLLNRGRIPKSAPARNRGLRSSTGCYPDSRRATVGRGEQGTDTHGTPGAYN
jgi:hypothetical protein